MTEQEIIQGCKKYLPRYQKELVLCYSKTLLGVIHRYTGRGAHSKDVLQEAFITIFKNLPKYKPTGSFSAWMKRIAITTALQYLRKSPYKKEVTDLEHIPDEFVPPDVYDQLAAKDLIDLISTLPDGFRAVFNLYAIEGYSHKEIGQMLDISESTSRSQLARARKVLQKKLRVQKKIRI